MHSLILAAKVGKDATTAHPGDEFMTLALALFVVALLITAIAAAVVTPGREHH